MLHYVCTGGCLTVQDSKGFCQATTCCRFRNPLTPCDCTDGYHGNWLFRNHPEPEKARSAAQAEVKKKAVAFRKAHPLTETEPAKKPSTSKHH